MSCKWHYIVPIVLDGPNIMSVIFSKPYFSIVLILICIRCMSNRFRNKTFISILPKIMIFHLNHEPSIFIRLRISDDVKFIFCHCSILKYGCFIKERELNDFTPSRHQPGSISCCMITVLDEV